MQCFVITWAPGAHWTEGASFLDQPFIEGHANHLDCLMQDGRIVLSGPFATTPGITPPCVGMTVLRAANEADIRAWLAADPAISHEVLTADLHAFQVIFAEPSYDRQGSNHG